MDLDPPRAALLKYIAVSDTNLAALARGLGLNAAYFHQFVYKCVPRNLKQEVREAVEDHLGLERGAIPSGLLPNSRNRNLKIASLLKKTPESKGLSLQKNKKERVYALSFDLDIERLQQVYPTPASWQNAYADIKRIFEKYGFYRQQGSVYFGDETVDPVKCVLATQDVTNTYSWFRFVVRDIRMLRIEENNDLLPAVEQ